MTLPRLAIALATLAIAAHADTIQNFQVELGSWNGSAFSHNGGTWNNSTGWAVGVTAPGQGNPMLSHVAPNSVPDGNYWLYMQSWGSGTALRITLFGASSTRQVVYTGPNVEFSSAWTFASGAGFIASLISAPQSSDVRVSSGQVYTGSGSNWIVAISTGSSTTATPEPATWLLAGATLGGLALLRKTKMAQSSLQIRE